MSYLIQGQPEYHCQLCGPASVPNQAKQGLLSTAVCENTPGVEESGPAGSPAMRLCNMHSVLVMLPRGRQSIQRYSSAAYYSDLRFCRERSPLHSCPISDRYAQNVCVAWLNSRGYGCRRSIVMSQASCLCSPSGTLCREFHRPSLSRSSDLDGGQLGEE